MARNEEPIFQVVKRRLEQSRGRWPDIAKSTSIPISTIRKIAQGQIADPGVSKVQTLLDHFAAVDAFEARRARAQREPAHV